ncbi:MAG: three-Cys-motif partner protein TcmP [Desulfobacterales bacterium]|nr:three-Cys-motif partner protein TcmP [Desulfobacterales bacterium]
MIPEHYKNREQTFIKHTILRRYLGRLFMIKGQFEPVICYIDCFAGPWQEDSSQMHDTSIAISLKIMNDCQVALAERGKNVKFAALYIEKDRRAYDKLVDYLQLDEWAKIETNALHGDFFTLRNAICDWCNNDSFAFFFVDPTGWKDVVEIETLRPLLQRKKSEYLINFMFDFILRTHTQEAFETHMRDIFGIVPNTANMTSDEREGYLIRLYRNSLKKASTQCDKEPRTARVRVLYPSRDRTFFDLIYLTRHPMGIRAFMEESEKVDIIQKMVRAKTKQEKRIEKTRQLEIFDDSVSPSNEVNIDLSVVKEYWLSKLEYTPKRFGLEKLADMLEETDWFISHFQEAFKELQKEGKVRNIDSARIRPKNVVHFHANGNTGERLEEVRS